MEEQLNIDIEQNADDLFIPYLIKCAKTGCKQSARELMKLSSEYLSSGAVFPDSLKPYLVEAFQNIAKGKSADKALYLSHGQGNNNTALYRKQAVANEVRRLYWIGEAKTIDEACKVVSERGVVEIGRNNDRFHVDIKTAYKYYYEIFPGTPKRCPIV